MKVASFCKKYFTDLPSSFSMLGSLFQPFRLWVICMEKMAHDQIKLQCTYSRGCNWRRLHVLTSRSDWFLASFAFALIGQSNLAGFGKLKPTNKGNLCQRRVDVQ